MSETDREPEQTGPVIRDNRRIDPVTYQVREPQTSAAPGTGADPGTGSRRNQSTTTSADATEEADTISAQNAADPGAELALLELQSQLSERTADLQRLQAEYVNYKRRVDRDRDLVRRATVENVLKEFLPVLDDVRSAREHGELTGAFKAVGEAVEGITGKQGLEAYGEQGDPFDPHIHEALLHSHAEGISGPTCVQILQPGYRIGNRVLRPARVAVAEPDPDAPGPEPVERTPAEPVEGHEAQSEPTRPEPVEPTRPEPVESTRPEPVEGPDTTGSADTEP